MNIDKKWKIALLGLGNILPWTNAGGADAQGQPGSARADTDRVLAAREGAHGAFKCLDLRTHAQVGCAHHRGYRLALCTRQVR